jgi:hypothetical protein
VDPTGLPAEVALRQAFSEYDVFLHYRPNPDTGAWAVQRAWVVPRGAGDRLHVLAEPVATTPEVGTAESAREALALHGLSVLPGTDPWDVLREALADPEESVRQSALLAVQATGLPLPSGALEGLVLDDPSETVRLTAMDLLAAEPASARAVLQWAAQDPKPVIRDHAAGLLSVLTADDGGEEVARALDTVVHDLGHRDGTVRQQALETALAYGLALTPEQLEQMLAYDTAEEVRASALTALAQHPEVDPERKRAVLEWATEDASPLIRNQAAGLLEALNPPTEEEPAPGDAPVEPDDASLHSPASDGPVSPVQ